MPVIEIDIDTQKNLYILSGDIINLISNRRSLIYLRDYLHVIEVKDHLKIPFETEEKEVVLQNIQKLLQKFGFTESTTSTIKEILRDYYQEEENFKLFSKQAFDIRNNQLDDLQLNQFKKFTDSLIINLPSRRLYPLQLLSSYHLAFSQNACNFSVPGSGKTSIVYGAYSYLKTLPDNDPKKIDRLLIIGPLSSFGPWENEYFECFGHKPSSKRISGGVPKSERIKHLYSSYPAELTLLSYLGVPGILDDIIFFLKKYRTMVILDEAHKIKNIEGGIIANSVLTLSKYCESRVVLTGTPAPNGYEDMDNLFQFIWPTKNIINFYPYQLKDMSQNTNDPRISKLLSNISPFFLRIRKSDLKIPEPIENEPIIVSMGPVQREIYNFIENKYMNFLKLKIPQKI